MVGGKGILSFCRLLTGIGPPIVAQARWTSVLECGPRRGMPDTRTSLGVCSPGRPCRPCRDGRGEESERMLPGVSGQRSREGAAATSLGGASPEATPQRESESLTHRTPAPTPLKEGPNLGLVGSGRGPPGSPPRGPAAAGGGQGGGRPRRSCCRPRVPRPGTAGGRRARWSSLHGTFFF